jgi:GT2 family glycosyltransferase
MWCAPCGGTVPEHRRAPVSVIVPTIGRPQPLLALLDSLVAQSRQPGEVIVANGGSDAEIARVIELRSWASRGLDVTCIAVQPAHAVRQRVAAIARARYPYLLLLDDDVVLEPDCLEQLLATVCADDTVVGVVADFNNQSWPRPTRPWRWYLRWGLGMAEGSWQGRVVGPLLRYGHYSRPPAPVAMDWLGSGNSLIRRDAYERAGGFSDFFLHRSTINEDVDLGLKLGRQGTILFCPSARLAHMHAPGGRASARTLAEDDLYNRYVILRRTVGHSAPRAFVLILIYFAIETASGFVASIRQLRVTGFVSRLAGRLSAILRIAVSPEARRA